MLIFLYSLSSLAISQLLFLALLYLLFFRKHIGAVLPLLLCICLIGMVVRLTILVDGTDSFWIVYPSQRLIQAVPAVIWILTYKLFADNRRVPLGAWVLIISYQTVLAILPFFWESGSTIYVEISRPAYVIMFAMGLHVIIMALSGRADDLILKRRRLRVPFAVGMGIICATLYGAVLIVSVFNSELTAMLGRVTYIACIASIFIFAMTVNLVMISLFADTPQFSQLINWDENSQIPPTPEQHSINPRTINKITELMVSEKLYEDPDLTISSLAKRALIKEHKLRRVINSGLGYRNFNQFLNYYRIKEACRLLLSEENPEHSISLISYEVGYASLSSFNKAFKDLTGMTPSTFRNDPELSSFWKNDIRFSP